MKIKEANSEQVNALSPDQIEENIHQALTENGYANFTKIRIKVSNQDIVLKGTVNSWDERKIIAHAVWTTPGVRMVRDLITIKSD